MRKKRRLFWKSQGLWIHLKRLLCMVLAIGMVLVGVPASALGIRTDYSTTLSTVEYFSEDAQARMQTVSTVKTERWVYKGTVYYKKWSENGVRIGNKQAVAFRSGPFALSRNLKTEEMTTSESGFNAAITVINNTIRQVDRKKRKSGKWNQRIALGSTEFLPKALYFKYAVSPVKLKGAASDALLIAIAAEPFSYASIQKGGLPGRKIRGGYRAILVYSPSEERLYQNMSTYITAYGKETVRVETMQFLSDESGDNPVVQLVDAVDFLQWSDSWVTEGRKETLPVWAVQAMRTYKVVHLAATVSAEKATNSGGEAVSFGFTKILDAAGDRVKDWAKDKAADKLLKDVPEYLKDTLSQGFKDSADLIIGEKKKNIERFKQLQEPLKKFYTNLTKDVFGEVQRVVNVLGGVEQMPVQPKNPVLTNVYVPTAADTAGIDTTTLVKPEPTTVKKAPTKTALAAGAVAVGVAAVAVASSGGGGDDGNGGGGGGSSCRGSASGSWSGICKTKYGNYTVKGRFSASVSSSGAVSGSYSGSDSGRISGSVDSSCTLSAGTSGGSLSGRWRGTLRPPQGSGSWTASGTYVGISANCNGRWSAP